MLKISNSVIIPLSEIEMAAIRSQGAGGQNVNKVSSAIHLRFDVPNSSLPDFYKSRILASRDQRITQDGVVVIKAQSYRTQEQNRQDALDRLVAMIKELTRVQKTRRPTKPTKASKKRRVDAKTKKGRQKQLRKKVDF